MWQHTEVAIKRIRSHKDGSIAVRCLLAVELDFDLWLQQNKERVRQGFEELRYLSRLRHDNILSLYAYSMDGSEPCLIYREYDCIVAENRHQL